MDRLKIGYKDIEAIMGYVYGWLDVLMDGQRNVERNEYR